jgi:hypothetical protein
VPDDGVAVAAEPREPFGEQPGGAAGLGAGGLVVVGVRGSRDGGGDGDPGEGGQPQQDDDETALDTPTGEGCHGRAPWGWFVDLCPEQPLLKSCQKARSTHEN